MIDFIIKYWVEFGFGIVVSIMGYVVKAIHDWKDEQDAIKNGVVAILHDRLYQVCQHFIELGYIPLDELKNIEHLYLAYKELGGNGTGKVIYERVCALPIKESED